MNNITEKLREKLFAFLSGDNPKYSKLVLFGAGDTYQLYKKSIEIERLQFDCFLDNDPVKYTQGSIDGKPIYSVRKYAEEGLFTNDTLVLIVSNGRARNEIRAQLNEAGVRSRYIDSFILRCHKEEIMHVFDMLNDDLSKQTYAQVLLVRAGEDDHIPAEIYSPNIYYALPPFFDIAEDDVFVDLGAYVGDTVETHVWKTLGTFKKIYAFEPESRSLAALKARVDRLTREWALGDDQIKIISAGIGCKSKLAHINRATAGKAARLGAQGGGGETTAVYSIDDFFHGKQEHITAIKADIESSEYDMLLGAEQTIKNDHPRLAICIYHSVSDFYTIPLLLKKYYPAYQLSVRHHGMRMAETVLYAYSTEY